MQDCLKLYTMEFRIRKQYAKSAGGEPKFLTPDGRVPPKCNRCKAQIDIQKDTERGHYWHSCRCHPGWIASAKEAQSDIAWQRLQEENQRYVKAMKDFIK